MTPLIFIVLIPRTIFIFLHCKTKALKKKKMNFRWMCWTLDFKFVCLKFQSETSRAINWKNESVILRCIFFPLPEMTKKLAKNVPKVSFLKVTLLCLRSLDRSFLSHIQLFMFFSSILFIWCPKILGRCCWVTAELIRQAAILVRAWCLWLSFLAALRQDCSVCAV